MPSIEDVVAGVHAVLDRVNAARKNLLRVLNSWENAGCTYATLGEGSTQPDLGNAAAYLEHAYDQVRTVVALLDHACARTHSYLTIIAGSPDHIEALRRELPHPIAPTDRGRKTHGRWIDANGQVHKIVSSQDALWAATEARLLSLGYPRLEVAAHAEMKLAEQLRQTYERTGQPQHAIIVVNNDACMGKWSCTKLLPVLLPAGCSLTVHAPNYRRTFTGGAIRDLS